VDGSVLPKEAPKGQASDTPDPVEICLAAARGGSREAQGRLLELCRQYLLHVANAELDSQLQVKAGGSDLVQETFFEALRIFERFQGESPVQFRAWLRAILVNKLDDFARHYQATAKRQIGKEVALAAGSQPGPEPAACLPSPSSVAVHSEQAVALTAALSRLPEHYRQVIVLRQIEDLSFEEMAARLGRTSEAVRKLWWRAVQQLQQELGTAL